MRWIALLALAIWGGSAFTLAEVQWFSHRSLSERLGPHSRGSAAADARPRPGLPTGPLESLRYALSPLATTVGEQVGRLVGVDDALADPLWRIHSSVEPTEFRLQQFLWGLAGLVAGLLFAVSLGGATAPALLSGLGGAVLAVLVVEHRVTAASSRWQQAVFHELPVIGEQVGMLLGAGYSMTSALHRIGERGKGCCAADLRRVHGRVQQGLSIDTALREWAAVTQVPALDRLVQVLALNTEAGDISRLISDEARSVRREVHRETIERIERRAEQVWIPVTVAALVPGVIFLAIPFLSALHQFGTG